MDDLLHRSLPPCGAAFVHDTTDGPVDALFVVYHHAALAVRAGGCAALLATRRTPAHHCAALRKLLGGPLAARVAVMDASAVMGAGAGGRPEALAAALLDAGCSAAAAASAPPHIRADAAEPALALPPPLLWVGVEDTQGLCELAGGLNEGWIMLRTLLALAEGTGGGEVCSNGQLRTNTGSSASIGRNSVNSVSSIADSTGSAVDVDVQGSPAGTASPRARVTLRSAPGCDWRVCASPSAPPCSPSLPLSALLALAATTVVGVASLPSGYARDVHGRMTVTPRKRGAEEGGDAHELLAPARGGSITPGASAELGRSVLFRVLHDGRVVGIGDLAIGAASAPPAGTAGEEEGGGRGQPPEHHHPVTSAATVAISSDSKRAHAGDSPGEGDGPLPQHPQGVYSGDVDD